MVEATPAPAGHDLFVAETLGASLRSASDDHRDDDRVRFVEAATLGRFVLLRKLGEGGMGEVFSAYDEQLDRRVAIKLLHASHAPDATRRRLLREAQALARLSHPNVVAIHEVGQTGNGDVFAVMEHIDGMTLRDWQTSVHAPDELIAAYRMAALGLTAVHAAGLVHRDFKPANVMVDRSGRIRLLDLGLAYAWGASPDDDAGPGERPRGELGAALTTAGSLVGTPAYMSPEQFMREPVGPASDQFSFCVALYEAIFAVHPFAGETMTSFAINVCTGAPPVPPVRPDVPAHVTAALLRGLSRDPAARFASMTALCDALEPGADPSGHRRERIAVASIVIGSMVAWLVYTELFGSGDGSVGHSMLPPALIGIGLLAAAVFHYRNSLLRNPFHRARVLTLLIMALAVVVSRVIGLRNGEDMHSVAVRDVLACAGATGVAAVWMRPRTWHLWAATAITALGAIAIAISADMVLVAAMLSMNLAPLLFLANWHAASRKTHRPDPESRRADAVSQRGSS